MPECKAIFHCDTHLSTLSANSQLETTPPREQLVLLHGFGRNAMAMWLLVVNRIKAKQADAEETAPEVTS